MRAKYDNLFLIGLAVFVFITSLLAPSTSTLLHPDSLGYLNFDKYRSALYPVFLDIFIYSGISIEQVPILQIFLFSFSVYYLLRAISRVCNNKLLLSMYVILLVGNIWLISLHKAILSESIYISSNMVAIAALINFFKVKSTKYILIFSLMIGLSIGIRPSGIAMLLIFPFIVIAANNYFKEFRWSWIFALIIPIIVMQLFESVLYRSYHGDSNRESILPVIIFGKGAIVDGSFKFNGPYKNILEQYSKEIDLEYGEVRSFLDKIPFFWLKNQSLPNYEIYAQFNVLRDRRNYFARMAGVTSNELMMEVGKQRILQGINQWIENSLYHYAASWALRVTSFPPFVREYNDWIKVQANIPFNKKIEFLPLKGGKSPSIISMIVFPGLLISGIVSMLIGITFITLLLLRRKMSLMFIFPGLLSIGVHGMLLFSSFVNVATPRYTITQFPVLLLVIVMFLFFIFETIKGKKSADNFNK